jgi:hypothetical protein
VKDALSFSAKARQPLSHLIHDQRRSSIVPPVPASVLQPHQVRKGLSNIGSSSSSQAAVVVRSDYNKRRYFPDSDPSSMTPVISHHADSPQTQHPTTLANDSQPQSSTAQDQDIQLQQQIMDRAQKRVQAQKAAQVRPGKKPRQPRTCRKCAKLECKGKRGVLDCKNPCRDCGSINCRGRNSHRPLLTCSEGWD